MKGWVLCWKKVLLPYFIRTTEQQVIKDFEKEVKESWKVLEKRGYTVQKCIINKIQKNVVIEIAAVKRVVDREIRRLQGTSTHGTCCTCQECKNLYDDCSCLQIRTLKDIREKLLSDK